MRRSSRGILNWVYTVCTDLSVQKIMIIGGNLKVAVSYIAPKFLKDAFELILPQTDTQNKEARSFSIFCSNNFHWVNKAARDKKY